MNYRMQIHSELSDIPEQEWNSLVSTANGGILHPGLRHEYLNALEISESAVPETGWAPAHLAVYSEDNLLVGAIPMYLKSHSYGEYVFDWAWAQAYERNGLRYYPKLLTAIPFTPIQGPKLLASNTEHRRILVQALLQFVASCAQEDSPIGTQTSTWHGLFLSAQDSNELFDTQWDAAALLKRHVVQFHWENKHSVEGSHYVDFDHYLSDLNQKKRKNIRAERRKVQEANVEIHRIKGSKIEPEHIEYFYNCYLQTYQEHYSRPYLTLGFFKQLVNTMPESIMLVMAYQDGVPVATSFFIYNQHRLYGRYWGCTERIKCLHFELCYYQAIEFAIDEKIQWFEGGAQGEHKMARGLKPCTLESVHWVADEGFHDAIDRFLSRERSHLNLYVDELNEHQAFKKS
ncbi:MAG: GNAT family N-acetyltransferase, partial [Limnobacter sp.]|nr:GNAT family N-acetyltransferase [Limnobacter sp.]